MPLSARADLWQLLVLLCYGGGISVFALLGFLAGWAIGKNRGYKTAPEKMQTEVRQARYERDMAAGRLAMAQEAAKRYETAMLELAGAVGQRPGLALVERRAR